MTNDDREKATPEMYSRVFEGHHEGAQILEDLTRRFGGALFVNKTDGSDGRRQTDFNLGRRSVLDFIIGQVNHANNVDPPEETDSTPAA
jgi:hypothetical protein